MSETLFSLLMGIGAVGIFWLGWHLRGEHDRPPFTTQPPTPRQRANRQAEPRRTKQMERLIRDNYPMKPPTSHVTRPSHHVSAPTRALYKIEPPANLLEPINLQAANKRNRERILANMRAGKRNN